MIQSILVPTDFSENALIAARYAMALAAGQGAAVHLVHAYLPFRSAFQTTHDNQENEERATAEAQEELDRFVQALGAETTNVSLTPALVQANVKDGVRQYIADGNIQLVVMGSHGSSGKRSNLLGSNTYDLAKSITVPLLIVPQMEESPDFGRVVFFTDYQPRDTETLGGAISLLGEQNLGHCTLVHIHEENSDPTEADRQRLESWKTKLESETGVTNMDTELVHAKESVEVVNEIIARLKPGLALLTMVEGRGFFERLTRKSLARAIILQPVTPILLINRHSSETDE